MISFSEFDTQEIITITFTLFAVIDVLGTAPVLLSLKRKMGGNIMSAQATLAASSLMIAFLFVGQQFLHLLGLDVKSFAVAGSIVIFIIGLEMILGLEFFKAEPDAAKSGSIVPIASPLIAGSGTLTTIISLKANFADINILAGILLNTIVIYVVLISLNTIERILGPNGLAIVRKFFGVILLAIAVKIFATNAHGLIK